MIAPVFVVLLALGGIPFLFRRHTVPRKVALLAALCQFMAGAWLGLQFGFPERVWFAAAFGIAVVLFMTWARNIRPY